MKHLDKLRDEKAEKYAEKIDDGDCFNYIWKAYADGWNDCQAEMMKVVEELESSLSNILKDLYKLANEKDADSWEMEPEDYICISMKQALAKIRKLEGEG